ncbi:small ribosomal subunit protein eS27y-like [Aristolochia californica]|uniref:small ribosomal subunit protein eS27y-like n=1 Tax=Aristolochia californica TaxID=171875 RepID=UPI0035DFF725
MIIEGDSANAVSWLPRKAGPSWWLAYIIDEICEVGFKAHIQVPALIPCEVGSKAHPNDIDMLNPPAKLEKKRHKLKRLMQSSNSFFMDVKCQGCFNITTVFNHSQMVVVCGNCQTVLCQPTGGRARLIEGCSFGKKGD